MKLAKEAPSRLQALSSLLLSVPDRYRKNEDFFRAIRRFVGASTPEERETALGDLNVWALRKQIEAETEGAEGAAKGFAKTLLDVHPEIVVHARRVPHLGALAPLAPLPATRWDYVRLLLRTLLEMKQQQPGLGLGSSTFGINHGKSSLSGLEIAQAWSVLGGYGHLFGTFATERGVLFALDSDSGLERRFVSQLATDLRTAGEDVLRRRDLYRTFYVLAGWRASRWSGSATRTTALLLLRNLLSPPPDATWTRLLWAFRRARQIAYTRLHSMLGVSIASSPIPIPRAVRELRPLSQISFLNEETEPRGAVAGLIDALDRFYGDVFFTSPVASERVLRHLKEFKLWWQASSANLEERLEALASEPVDWPTSSTPTRAHFARLHVPDGGIGWTNEVRQWLRDGNDTWDGGNFLITPSRRRGDECSVVDLYVQGPPTPRLVAHVASILAARNEATWAAAQSTQGTSRDLWRSVAGFGLSLFQLLLAKGRLAQLEPVSADGGVGLAIAATSATSGCGRIHGFAQRVDEEARRAELDALREVALRVAPRDAVWFAFLGRLRILDEESGRPLQELDGIFALIGRTGIEWHFVEHKGGDAGGMRGQLDELARHLAVAVPACDFVSVANGKAAHTAVLWPAAPAEEGV